MVSLNLFCLELLIPTLRLVVAQAYDKSCKVVVLFFVSIYCNRCLPLPIAYVTKYMVLFSKKKNVDARNCIVVYDLLIAIS